MEDTQWKMQTETRIRAMETALAVSEVRQATILSKFDKIEGTLTWLVRLVMGAIILAFVSYAVQGGLNV